MSVFVGIKVTEPEEDVIDWLQHKLNLESRGQTLRFALIETAKREGLPLERVQRLRLERQTVRPRRSAKLTRLVGKRRPADRDQGLAV